MNKKSEPLFACAYSDSQRLKDAFFSPKPKKKKLHPRSKKILIISSSGIAFLILITSVTFLLKYELIVIPRGNIELEKNTLSLFGDNFHSSIKIFERNKLITKKGSPIYLNLLSKEKTALRIDFAKPVNLENNSLTLYLNNKDTSFKINAVAKDNRFFSNSLKPLIIEVSPINNLQQEPPAFGENNPLYLKIPIEFKNNPYEKTNLSKITQVKLYFYPQDALQPKNSSSPEPVYTETKLSEENLNRNGVIIKDIVLVKK